MSSESLSELVRYWFDQIWNKKRPEVLSEMMTPHSVSHSDRGPIVGPDQFRQQVYQPFVAAMPDLQVQVQRTVSERDEIVVIWFARGTHSGDGFGFPATQRYVEFYGLTWFCIRNAKMIEGRDGWNSSGLMNELMLPVHCPKHRAYGG